jgi:hypothetical protein
MAKAQNSDGENIGVLLEKLELYTSILEGSKVQPSESLKTFYNNIRGKRKEEALSGLIDLYLNFCCSKDDYTNVYRSKIFKIINSQFSSTFDGKKFTVNNFTKIVKLAFSHEPVEYGLIELIENLAKKNEPSLQERDDRYQYIKSEYKEISGEIERLKKVFVKDDINKLYSFFNFIYETKRNIEEQDKAKELESKKAEEELLKEESLCKQEVSSSLQPQKNKKKKKKSKKSKQTVWLSSREEVESDGLLQASNDKEVPINDDKVAEIKWSEKLSTLIHSKFPSEESQEFEEKIRQAISELEAKDQVGSDNQEIDQLYSILIDFYLSDVQRNIKNYNSEYGQLIARTKGLFGTDNFEYYSNQIITSNLKEIASYINKINSDLKEAHLLLDKITPLVYRDHNNKSQDNQWLEITGSDNLKLLLEFLDHLKNLGEWRKNKLKFVTENNVRSSEAKTNEEKTIERDAFKDIASCVNSIDGFMSIYNKSFAQNNVNLPIYGPHQQWCILNNPKIEQVKMPKELQGCSC